MIYQIYNFRLFFAQLGNFRRRYHERDNNKKKKEQIHHKMDPQITIAIDSQLIIALAAGYGAALSTLNFYIHHYYETPRVKIKIIYGFVGTPGYGIDYKTLTISAMNVGKRSVKLAYVGFELPYKSISDLIRRRRYVLQFPCPDDVKDAKLPYELLPGSNFDYSKNISSFADSLKKEGYSGTIKLTGYFKDQIDNTYRSKSFKFNIDR